MKVPLLDLHQQTIFLRDEILRAITDVVDSTGYILGPKVAELEQAVAAYSGTAAAVGVSSGTDALLMSLMALEIGQGDLVLTTPYSFFATAGAILRVGALPVFADVEPESFNLDPNKMAELLEADQRRGRRIKAVIPVHLFGQCADMGRILALAEQHDIPVIEDAAQAIGAECPLIRPDGTVIWQRAGAMGLAGCFSFFPSKNLGCLGDGGMVVAADAVFAEILRCYRNHGAQPKYYHSKVGGNFRLDPLQAAVLSVKLPHLEQWHRHRQANSRTYRKLFEQAGLIDTVVLPPAVHADRPDADSHHHHIYNQFVVRVPSRDALREHLQKNSVGCEVYYPVCLHKQECMKKHGFGDLSLPVAEQASRDTLALPIFPELSPAQQERVVEVVASFYHV